MKRTDPTGASRGATPPILAPDGTPLVGSVATLERVSLGETRQWILIRGRSTDNPVLLFLSGGLPLSDGACGSDIARIRSHSQGLEDQFTVVTWDQRGAGKSVRAGFPRAGMTVRQLTSDALELVAMLRKRFDQRKIFLVGNALGTVVAVRMVQERPEWFHAYISAGQMVNPAEHDRAAWQYVLDGAVARGDASAARRLRRAGAPPYLGRDRLWRYSLLARLGTRYLSEDHGIPKIGLTDKLPAVTELTLLDRLRLPLGAVRTFQTIYPRLQKLDLVHQSPQLGVPVFLLAGGRTVVSSSLIERYHEVLDAPHKALVRFEQSGLAPCFDEPDRFNRWLVDTVLPFARRTPTPTRQP